jgi:hypothetical protein
VYRSWVGKVDWPLRRVELKEAARVVGKIGKSVASCGDVVRSMPGLRRGMENVDGDRFSCSRLDPSGERCIRLDLSVAWFVGCIHRDLSEERYIHRDPL